MVKSPFSGRRWSARPIVLWGVVLLALVPVSGRAVAGTTTPSEILYVGNSSAGPVFGYNAVSSGSASPIREADTPNNPNTIWDPETVAFDTSGNLYVQSFASNADTFVYAPPPRRGDKPIRIFQLYGPDTQAIGVDHSGYEYVLSGDACCFVAVGPPRAAGTFSHDYYVRPLRTLGVGFAYPPFSQTLTIANGHNPVVVIPGAQNNSLVTYQGGRDGSANPLRIIRGRTTSLGACRSLITCDQIAITASTSTGLLYAAVSSGPTLAHIAVFNARANGNVKPLQVVEGAATGLTGRVITGIAVSELTGDIFVMVKRTQFGGPGQVEVFGRHAHGNVLPIRTFVDRTTKFADAMGIALGSG
jgi:hypothetical protein